MQLLLDNDVMASKKNVKAADRSTLSVDAELQQKFSVWAERHNIGVTSAANVLLAWFMRQDRAVQSVVYNGLSPIPTIYRQPVILELSRLIVEQAEDADVTAEELGRDLVLDAVRQSKGAKAG